MSIMDIKDGDPLDKKRIKQIEEGREKNVCVFFNSLPEEDATKLKNVLAKYHHHYNIETELKNQNENLNKEKTSISSKIGSIFNPSKADNKIKQIQEQIQTLENDKSVIEKNYNNYNSENNNNRDGLYLFDFYEILKKCLNTAASIGGRRKSRRKTYRNSKPRRKSHRKKSNYRKK